MKAALKKKWIAALRSGEYKQGAGALRARNSSGADEYCCLGVLADIGGCQWHSKHDGMFGVGSTGITFHTTMLPDAIARRFGLGVLSDPAATQKCLAGMNDDGWSFKRIATWIEKHL